LGNDFVICFSANIGQRVDEQILQRLCSHGYSFDSVSETRLTGECGVTVTAANHMPVLPALSAFISPI
jgi:hypothetical protein